MLRNSFTKWLRDNRRSVLGWTAAIAGVGGSYAAFWPTIDNPQMRQAMENYPAAVLEALNYTDICPVGALTSNDFRFQMRVWFLEETKSICTS